MIFAEVSSGRSLFATSSPTKVDRPGSAADATFSTGAAPSPAARRLEGRGAHRDHLLGVLRLHGLDRVAGIDRPLEGVGRDHLDDLGDLHDVEQGCDARHHVLEARGRGRDDGVIGRRQRHDQRGERLGKIVLVGRAFGDQHLLHAGELGGGFGRGLGALAAAGDQHMHVAAELGRCGQRLVGDVLQGFVVVFGNQQRRHLREPRLRSSAWRPARRRP